MGIFKKGKNAEPEDAGAGVEQVKPLILDELKAELLKLEAELVTVDEEISKVESDLARIKQNEKEDDVFARQDMERLYKERLENQETFSKFMDAVYKAKMPTDTMRNFTLKKLSAVHVVISRKRHQLQIKLNALKKQISDEENRIACEVFLASLDRLFEHLREGLSHFRKLKSLRAGLDEAYLHQYLVGSSDSWAKYYLQLILSGMKPAKLPELSISDLMTYAMTLTIDSPTGKPILERDLVEINAKRMMHITEPRFKTDVAPIQRQLVSKAN